MSNIQLNAERHPADGVSLKGCKQERLVISVESTDLGYELGLLRAIVIPLAG